MRIFTLHKFECASLFFSLHRIASEMYVNTKGNYIKIELLKCDVHTILELLYTNVKFVYWRLFCGGKAYNIFIMFYSVRNGMCHSVEILCCLLRKKKNHNIFIVSYRRILLLKDSSIFS